MIFPDNWHLIDKINFIQRKILLNSMMYYDYDMSYISDHHYDDCCKKLVKLHNIYGPDFIEDSMYGYVYYDFDGSTGFHLTDRLTIEDREYLRSICKRHIFMHPRKED